MTKEYLHKKFDEETDLIATHDTEDYIEWLEAKVEKLQHPTAAQKPNLESPWISYAQGNGLHVAVDSAGTVWTSKDGRQWTLRDG